MVAPQRHPVPTSTCWASSSRGSKPTKSDFTSTSAGPEGLLKTTCCWCKDVTEQKALPPSPGRSRTHARGRAESPARDSLHRALQVQRCAFEVPSSEPRGWRQSKPHKAAISQLCAQALMCYLPSPAGEEGSRFCGSFEKCVRTRRSKALPDALHPGQAARPARSLGGMQPEHGGSTVPVRGPPRSHACCSREDGSTGKGDGVSRRGSCCRVSSCPCQGRRHVLTARSRHVAHRHPSGGDTEPRQVQRHGGAPV